MYYVTMTDKIMSGWGMAEGKTNKLIFTCETWKEAKIVEDNAQQRSEMKHVNICMNKPWYNDSYKVSWKDKNDCKAWYETNYFRKAKYEREAREAKERIDQ